MAQLILDDQLSPVAVWGPLRRWITAEFIREVQPGEVIKDERIPQILRGLRRPTLVTIDSFFWNERWRDPRYCILFFAFTNDEQRLIPNLLRRLLHVSPFRSAASRMGIVARVSNAGIE